MMGWDGPILTDSGGFQVFSLSDLRKVTDEGVEFRSHIDGSKHFLTPEKVVEAQRIIGSDIMMPLDECAGYPSSKAEALKALERTTKWAKRSKDKVLSSKFEGNSKLKVPNSKQVLFGIVQGGMFSDLRKRSAEEIREIDLPGYAVGGLSVGEPKEMMLEMLEVSTDNLEFDKPKHLMGVGYP